MWMTTRLVTALMIAGLCFSCSRARDNFGDVSQSFLDSLMEKQIGTTNYFISVPKDFEIQEEEGIDFTVFYFVDSDTLQSNLNGGLYFGNYPGLFPQQPDSCNSETVKSKILGNNSTWTIYYCQGEYLVETIVENKESEGWNDRIHAFGHGRSREDIYKILRMYSTFHRKKV